MNRKIIGQQSTRLNPSGESNSPTNFVTIESLDMKIIDESITF